MRRQGDSYYFDTFRLVDRSEQVHEMQPSDPRFIDAVDHQDLIHNQTIENIVQNMDSQDTVELNDPEMYFNNRYVQMEEIDYQATNKVDQEPVIESIVD